MTEPASLRTTPRHIVFTTEVWYDRRLMAEDLRVLGMLYEMGYSTGACIPSRSEIARRCHISLRQVDGSVERLVTCGYVKTVKRWKDRDGHIYYEAGPGRTNASTQYLVNTHQGTSEHPGRAPRDSTSEHHEQGTTTKSSSSSSFVVPTRAVSRTATPKSDPWKINDPNNFSGSYMGDEVPKP